jgi:hypothetical protein
MIAFGQERSGQAFASAHGGSVARPDDFVRPLLLLAGAGILIRATGSALVQTRVR